LRRLPAKIDNAALVTGDAGGHAPFQIDARPRQACHFQCTGNTLEEPMKRIACALVCAVGAGGAAAAESTITAISFGRADQAALTQAYYRPFTAATGIDVKSLSYDGQTTELKQMAKADNAPWDVIQVESRTLQLGCENGLFEKLDYSRIAVAKSDFIPGALSDCGVGIFAWSVALAYDADKLKTAPRSWADVWNLKKFPGKRGLRRSAKYTLEIALLADGVPVENVYKVLATKEGVDRAFRKLDGIKDHVIWWTSAPDPQLYLEDGRLVMTLAYTLWLNREQARHSNLRVAWDKSLYDVDSWAIPKNTGKAADAYRFISFASQAENQKAFSQELAYGPTNKKALPLLGAALASTLPSAETNLRDALKIDTAFWIVHGEALEKRFDNWAPQLCAQQTDEDEDAVDYKGQTVCQDNRGNLRKIESDVAATATHHQGAHVH
jgi:putative spermidine/putrescine transport system substrate-binding protein